METLLFAIYAGAVSAVSINLIRMKFQVDMEEEIKKLREYDLSTEKIKIGTDKIDDDSEYVVLAKHKAKDPQEEPKLP